MIEFKSETQSLPLERGTRADHWYFEFSPLGGLLEDSVASVLPAALDYMKEDEIIFFFLIQEREHSAAEYIFTLHVILVDYLLKDYLHFTAGTGNFFNI